MDYSIYDYNSDEKLLQEQEIEEINNVKMSLLNTLVTKLNNAGIYFNSTSRIKSESSLLHKLETGKYSMQEGGRKIQDIIGIRINLFYLETVRSACLASDHAAQALIGVSRVNQYHCLLYTSRCVSETV